MSAQKYLHTNPTRSTMNQRLFARLNSRIKRALNFSPESLPQHTPLPEVPEYDAERVALKVFETDKGIDIECDLSSFAHEDIRVAARKDCLIIEASAKESANMSFYLGNPLAEDVRQVIPLGFTIGKHSFRSQQRNGILVVHVDKPLVNVKIREEAIGV